MTKKLVNTGTAMKKIVNTGQVFARIAPAQIAAALGAEPVPESQIGSGSPLALLAVRQEMARRLQSSGGRPALTGTTRRVKIPLSDEEWRQLEAIAHAIAAADCAPSAGQVASVLLNLALQSVLADLNAKPAPTKEQLREKIADAQTKS
jgi:hypothetical protein